jgi:hypothetical protein
VAAPAVVYERRRPEETTLYQVVQDNLATLYGAVDDGALAIALPRFVKKEREGYLDCGLLCRGFARLRCDGCEETGSWRSAARAADSVRRASAARWRRQRRISSRTCCQPGYLFASGC